MCQPCNLISRSRYLPHQIVVPVPPPSAYKAVSPAHTENEFDLQSIRRDSRSINSMRKARLRARDTRCPVVRPVREVRASANIDSAPKHPICIRLRKLHVVRARRCGPIPIRIAPFFGSRLCSLHVQHIRSEDQCACPWTDRATLARCGSNACCLANAHSGI